VTSDSALDRRCWALNASGSPAALVMGWDKDGNWTSIGEPGPVVWASGQLLAELHDGCPDFVELDCILSRDPQNEDAPIGDVIRITGDDCRYVYVVRRCVRAEDPTVFELAWPD
jgi:hypothetical protein